MQGSVPVLNSVAVHQTVETVGPGPLFLITLRAKDVHCRAGSQMSGPGLQSQFNFLFRS